MDRLARHRLSRKWRKGSSLFRLSLVSLVLVSLHSWLFLGPVGQRVEPYLLNGWFALRETQQPPSEVSIVAIDERSYEKLGLSYLDPWPRQLFVELMHRLKQYNAKVVIYDAVFNSAGSDAAVDQRLAQSFSELPTFIGEYEVDQSYISGAVGAEKTVVSSQEQFKKNAKGVVNLNCPLDFGMWRRFPLIMDQGRAVPNLAKALFSDSKLIRPFPQSGDFINFYGPARTITAFPIADVLKDSELALRESYENRVVLIGTQILADIGYSRKDTFLTPVSRRSIYGVEVHATVVANLLREEWIRRFSPKIELTILNLLTLFLALAVYSLKPKQAVVFGLLFGAALVTLSFVGFLYQVFIPCVVLVGLVLPLALFVAVVSSYTKLHRSHEKISDAFGVKSGL